MAYERIVHQGIKSVEQEWKEFRDAVLKCSAAVFGCRLVGQRIRKESVWWNVKIRSAVAITVRQVFGKWPAEMIRARI